MMKKEPTTFALTSKQLGTRKSLPEMPDHPSRLVRNHCRELISCARMWTAINCVSVFLHRLTNTPCPLQFRVVVFWVKHFACKLYPTEEVVVSLIPMEEDLSELRNVSTLCRVVFSMSVIVRMQKDGTPRLLGRMLCRRELVTAQKCHLLFGTCLIVRVDQPSRLCLFFFLLAGFGFSCLLQRRSDSTFCWCSRSYLSLSRLNGIFLISLLRGTRNEFVNIFRTWCLWPHGSLTSGMRLRGRDMAICWSVLWRILLRDMTL